jgi:hypothetical protein
VYDISPVGRDDNDGSIAFASHRFGSPCHFYGHPVIYLSFVILSEGRNLSRIPALPKLQTKQSNVCDRYGHFQE